MDLIERRGRAGLTTQQDLEADARQFVEDAEHALSPKTRSAYAYQWERFAAWCHAHGLSALPTDPQTVAAYFGHLARPQTYTDGRGRDRERAGCGPSTFAVVRAAIRYMHDRLPPTHPGRDVNLATAEIRRFIQGNKRKRHAAGRKINKAEPFLVSHWLTLNDLIGTSDDLYDIRDLALLGLGVVRALRGPSELLALDLGCLGDGRGEIHVRAAGAVIRMHVTKTEQDGDDDDRTIEEGLALAALRRWIAAADIARGSPLFRPLPRNPKTKAPMVGPGRLAGRSLHDIVRARARQVLQHLEPDMSAEEAETRSRAYSTHSLRHGALTALGNAGATMAELMELSRHSPNSAGIVMGYVKRDNSGARAMKKVGM